MNKATLKLAMFCLALVGAIAFVAFVATVAIAWVVYEAPDLPSTQEAKETSAWPDGRMYWGARLDLLEAQVAELQEKCPVADSEG